MNNKTLCPFRMLNKEFVDESLCLREKCELWSSGFKRCALRLLTLLPYLEETLQEGHIKRKHKPKRNYRN